MRIFLRCARLCSNGKPDYILSYPTRRTRMAQTFQDMITNDRARLSSERDAIRAKQRELETQLTAIDREFKAIEAYEAAKSGKATRQTGARRASGGRKGSKRDDIIAVLQANPDGLSRGEILEQMGLKGNKT